MLRDSRGCGKKSYGIPAVFKVNFTAMILHGEKTSQTVIFRWHCYKRRIKHKVYNIRFISRFRALLQILDSLPPWGWNGDGSNFLAWTVGDGDDMLWRWVKFLSPCSSLHLQGMNGDAQQWEMCLRRSSDKILNKSR